ELQCCGGPVGFPEGMLIKRKGDLPTAPRRLLAGPRRESGGLVQGRDSQGVPLSGTAAPEALAGGSCATSWARGQPRCLQVGTSRACVKLVSLVASRIPDLSHYADVDAHAQMLTA